MKSSVSIYTIKYSEENHNKKSLEGRFQRKLQTAVSGTEYTVTTETGKTIHRSLLWTQLYFRKKEK